MIFTATVLCCECDAEASLQDGIDERGIACLVLSCMCSDSDHAVFPTPYHGDHRLDGETIPESWEVALR